MNAGAVGGNDEWTRIRVARALQPEICPERLERQVFASLVRVHCWRLVSREAAKARRKER